MDQLTLGSKMAKVFKTLGGKLSSSMNSEKLDISLEQYVVLEALHNQKSMILQEMSDYLKKDKSTLLRVIDALESKKFVVRIPDSEDRRKKNLVLTKKGTDIYLKGLEIETGVCVRIMDGLSDQQLEEFSEIVDILQHNLK